MGAIDSSRISVAAQAVGIARAVLEAALSYTQEPSAVRTGDLRFSGRAMDAGRYGH